MTILRSLAKHPHTSWGHSTTRGKKQGRGVSTALLLRGQVVGASVGPPLVDGDVAGLVVALVVLGGAGLAGLSGLAGLARGGAGAGGGGGHGDGGVGGDDARGHGGVLGALVGQGRVGGAGNGGLGGRDVLVVLVDLALDGRLAGRGGDVAGVVVAGQGVGVGLLDSEAATDLVLVDAADGTYVTGRG